ncbi:MAG: alpha/beta fold hydrolase [Spirochaetales bacterium]|nr:alpha/beta fold hydrolase [Spirochaetales bacterium]
MNWKVWLTVINTALFLLCGSVSSDSGDSFSFDELINAPDIDMGEPRFFTATDGVKIAYYVKAPTAAPEAVLIFIHGGGAHSAAGYRHLAHGLSTKHNVCVYLFDIRGHGRSGGPRGDTPTVEQVWHDVKTFNDRIRAKHKGVPLYLGGYSSGGGLVLNYLAWEKKSPVDGYVFISPHFGYKSGTERKNIKHPFARVDMDVFIANAVSQGKEYGNTPAVYFNYTEERLQSSPLLLRYITCNMSYAVTPQNPQKQFKKIDKKFALFVGENDELFIPEKVTAYADLAGETVKKQSTAEIVKGEGHLSVLLCVDELIYKVIKEQ